MNNDRYRNRVLKVLEQLDFNNITPRFNSSILADYAVGGDNDLRFFMGCSFVSDPISFRIDGNEISYTSDQAKILGRIPGFILGKDWKKFYIILLEQDYYSIFGNYPLISLEDYPVHDKLNPKLYWKKTRVMIEDKRKRERTWLGKLRGVSVKAKENYIVFTLSDLVKHLEHSLIFTEQ